MLNGLTATFNTSRQTAFLSFLDITNPAVNPWFLDYFLSCEDSMAYIKPLPWLWFTKHKWNSSLFVSGICEGIATILIDLNEIPRHAFKVPNFSSPSDQMQLRLEAMPNHLVNLLVNEKVCCFLFLFFFLLFFFSCTDLFFFFSSFVASSFLK